MDNYSAIIEVICQVGDKIEEVKRAIDDQKNRIEASVDQNMGWLAFTLPQNESEMRVAMNGSRYLRVLYELDMWCRSIDKHDSGRDDPHTFREKGGEGWSVTLEDLRNKIRELMADEGVSLEDGE